MCSTMEDWASPDVKVIKQWQKKHAAGEPLRVNVPRTAYPILKNFRGWFVQPAYSSLLALKVSDYYHTGDDLFKLMEQNTGEKINELFVAWDIADILSIQNYYNVTPLWITPSILEELKLIISLSFYNLFLPSSTNRLRAGPLVKDILENIDNIIQNKSGGKKAKFYSAVKINMLFVKN
ncbi:unnamed protein product [Didymodactylos carnosus]|uniref:Uncharacterized protein n=1 Tax=Didymodactylos carnosus TaxID=1234261 RepID=A0A8S2IAY7_9BILA|nr:unnamed protein product [Didymodactylos carnosus]CAF3734492.1 unnamed protein product [Didymodactylos carnosus]